MAEKVSDSHYSVPAYLEFLAHSPEKWEYHDGRVYAMGGGTIKHGMICQNLYSALRIALNAGKIDCIVLGPDVKLCVETWNAYLFPDAFVVCGDLQRDAQDPEAVTNPTVVIEVLSTSTSEYDQTDKFRKYRSIASFQEYVLISQKETLVECWLRKSANTWEISTVYQLDQPITLKSLGVTINLADLYKGTEKL